MEAILFAFSTFISTMSGGLFALRFRDKLHYIMSFAAGVLLAVSILELLPEITNLTTENHLPLLPSLIALVVGFLGIHILEKLAILHHAHEEEYADHKHPLVGVVSVSGLSFHSFLDGVGIGLGFQVSFVVGLIVTIAVIAHDFTDGLNAITLMLVNKNTVKKAFLFLLLDATTPILGALSTYLFTIPKSLLALYLGFFAGFLLYIGASDLLPEAHSKHSSFRLIALTIAGVLFIFIITRFV